MGFKTPAAPRTLKLPVIGSTVTGIVHSVDEEMQMTFDANNRPNGPRFDENGHVVLGTVVVIAALDDKGNPTPNLGKLRIGDAIFTDDRGKPNGMETTSGLKVAIQEALGDDDLDVGDLITVQYIADEPTENPALSGAKVYAVTVKKSA
jgi:hypothetical protein